MERRASEIENILNIKELAELFKHFSLATQVDVTMYDKNNAEILFFGDSDGVCRKSNCTHGEDVLAFSAKKSFELSASYIFITPCGLIKCVFPIAYENSMLGYVTCGPVMLWEDDEFARSEFENSVARLLLSTDADISKVKQYDCSRMTSIAELLYSMVSKLVESQKKYIQQRYEITKLAKEKERLLSKANVIHETSLKYPAEVERELITCVQLGRRNRAKEIINQFLGDIFTFAGGDLDIIKMKLYEFVAFLSRSAVENGASIARVKSLLSKTSEITNEKTDYHDLCFATVEILDGFLDLVEEVAKSKIKTVSHLEKALAVIAKTYSENPSLEKVAEESAVSPYYLSHLFKEKLGTTFVEYMTSVKIEKAKELLKSGNTVETVSEAVGYNDSNYFSKIFKKQVGLTPTQYKKAK